jgi:hypothetical protein
MNGKTTNVEVSSTQLLNELIEIKDRVGALESVAGIANREILIGFFRDVLNNTQRRQIMAACQVPQTRAQLVKLGYNSIPALEYHLKPLREGLIHETHNSNGAALFEWSLLFKRLPQKKREELLNEPKQTKK